MDLIGSDGDISNILLAIIEKKFFFDLRCSKPWFFFMRWTEIEFNILFTELWQATLKKALSKTNPKHKEKQILYHVKQYYNQNYRLICR